MGIANDSPFSGHSEKGRFPLPADTVEIQDWEVRLFIGPRQFVERVVDLSAGLVPVGKQREPLDGAHFVGARAGSSGHSFSQNNPKAPAAGTGLACFR